jgi:methionine-rich copper-binding protein CopC
VTLGQRRTIHAAFYFHETPRIFLMIAIRTIGLVALTTAGFAAFVPPTAPTPGIGLRRHTHLTKSEPADNDTLARSPRALRLWFTERVELAVTTVKLANAAGAPVTLASVARPDGGQDAPVVALLKTPLAAGAYVVTWTTAALDGHPAKGTFGFVVKAAP